MLVLSRRVGEALYIGDDIVITLVDIQGNKVRLGISAPRSTDVAREELLTPEERARRRKLAGEK